MTFVPLHSRILCPLPCALALVVLAIPNGRVSVADDRVAEPKQQEAYAASVRPILAKYCLNCHSTKSKKGSLDLERFASVADLRKDLKVWQGLIEQVEAGEMPPREKPQPTAEEKKLLLDWVRTFLDSEAKARSGDPGHVPLRRLSNAEYNYTIRDLTGVDLQPAREFPADGAAGEGFTNAAEALTDISPALFTKYLNAAKDIAEHAVLLPDGFRFSPSKTRRDWTDEGTAALRKFYSAYTGRDGKLNVQPYLTATIRHREALAAGKFAEAAAKEKLNTRYLEILWKALSADTMTGPLSAIREKWRTATEKDVPQLMAGIDSWQKALWKTAAIGSYLRSEGGVYVESLTRQFPVDPPALETLPLRVAVKPGSADVMLYLAARDLGPAGRIVWQRPRFERAGKPTLLLSDYEEYGRQFELDYAAAFANSSKYLAAVIEAVNEPQTSTEEVAKRHGLDSAFLKQWVKVLAVLPYKKPEEATREATPLALLDDRTERNAARPSITGWKKKGIDLPVLVANSSDKVEHIPGRVSARGVAVHPTPQEFVAVAWKSPLTGTVSVAYRVAHAHPACGNGVAWWIERRHGEKAAVVGEGVLDLGQEAKPPVRTLKVEKGDMLVLAVDARNGDHTCDMTEIEFKVTEAGESKEEKRVWDLAADIAADVGSGNPHADRYRNADTWSFVRGASRKTDTAAATLVPAGSLLAHWRAAAADPERKDEAAKLAADIETLLSGPQPQKDKSTDRQLYDHFVATDGPLFTGVDIAKLAKPRKPGAVYGVPKARFDNPDKDSLIRPTGEVVEIRLPAALLVGREFVVDARLDGPAGNRLVQARAAVEPPAGQKVWNGPVLAAANGEAYKQLLAANAEFRRVFPLFLCFPNVVPTDEVVTLKMFHREDDDLRRLFLSEEESQRLDRLWTEHRFVSRQPAAEYDYLPQFMAYTTQDTPKALQQFFIDRKPLFQKKAAEFEAEELAAVPRQIEALLAFAEKAYRRPLQEKERNDLRQLYQTIRGKGAAHAESFRGVLVRILTAPAFLFRIENAPRGKAPAPVDDWELATRLSYFLWASVPDQELQSLAAAGKLRDPKVLEAQTRRMLLDPKTRALAIEFGTQWIHVRGFDELKEKNETLFPTFTPELRKAIYEESILFFLDLFQSDRAVTSILDADHTFLDETLAKHYGIPGVSGPHWRKVEGIRKYGRGGVLGLASVQTKEAGASRTSPVLRGNWVVETLLGEKLPRPPANVPQLPEMEGTDRLTMRQLVEKHVSVQSCAACHVRIDPFGFALESYDPIGRLRVKDLGGLPVDTRARLKDGTEFAGIEGLRNYLLTKKKDVVVHLFCRRLLGYALGRAVTLSDTAIIDEMVAELNRNDGKVSAAVNVIVRSPQFRMVRGSEQTE